MNGDNAKGNAASSRISAEKTRCGQQDRQTDELEFNQGEKPYDDLELSPSGKAIVDAKRGFRAWFKAHPLLTVAFTAYFAFVFVAILSGFITRRALAMLIISGLFFTAYPLASYHVVNTNDRTVSRKFLVGSCVFFGIAFLACATALLFGKDIPSLIIPILFGIFFTAAGIWITLICRDNPTEMTSCETALLSGFFILMGVGLTAFFVLLELSS